MLRLIITLLVFSLSACESMPKKSAELDLVQPTGSINAFATLASFGTFEMELAPLYTRLAVLRHNAARDLQKGKINVGTAKKIQMYADVVRSQLDQAKDLDAAKKTDQAREVLAALDQALFHLEGMLP